MSFERETECSRAKRQRIAPLTPATVGNLSADLWCGIADFLPKTSRALLAVALTAPPASFRESGWKGQPNAVSKAIISSVKDGLYTGGQMPFDTLLDELCEEARGETQPDGYYRRLRDGRGYFRQALSNQMKEYYNYCGLNSRQISEVARSNESYFHFENSSNEERKDLNDKTTWNVIDFVDIPVSLASRLTDDDIGATLICIDAKNKLKRLNLTNCFNFVGHGLEPLRSSTVLEILDLGMYRHFETPLILQGGVEGGMSFRENKLSEEPVCDIVDSILRGEGESPFERLQYPYEWYHKLLDHYDTLLTCIMDQIMRSKRMKDFVNGHNAVVVKNSCCVYFNYDSKEEFCSHIVDFSSDMTDECMGCNDVHFAVCSHCNEVMCVKCTDNYMCTHCLSMYCRRCENDGFDDVSRCDADYCDSICTECRFKVCRSGENNCRQCRSMAFSTLSEKHDSQQEELDGSKSRIEELERSKSIMFTDDPPITIRINDTTGETLVTVERGTKMKTLFQAFADRKNLDVSDLRFTLRGETIQSSATPESLDLNDMAEIEAAW